CTTYYYGSSKDAMDYW
nr:immunoglobulin heavy chain junction region [Mus musculus]